MYLLLSGNLFFEISSVIFFGRSNCILPSLCVLITYTSTASESCAIFQSKRCNPEFFPLVLSKKTWSRWLLQENHVSDERFWAQ